jgi:hypothetical protein
MRGPRLLFYLTSTHIRTLLNLENTTYISSSTKTTWKNFHKFRYPPLTSRNGFAHLGPLAPHSKTKLTQSATSLTTTKISLPHYTTSSASSWSLSSPRSSRSPSSPPRHQDHPPPQFFNWCEFREGHKLVLKLFWDAIPSSEGPGNTPWEKDVEKLEEVRR